MTELSIAVQKAYDWNLWILPKVEKFSKSYRFSLGQNLTALSLELLTSLVDATYQQRNAAPLSAAVRNVNRIRFPIRLAKDLQQIDLKAYEFASQGLDELGRMTGGWRKFAQEAGASSPQ